LPARRSTAGTEQVESIAQVRDQASSPEPGRDFDAKYSRLETTAVDERWRDSYETFLETAAERLRSTEGAEREHVRIIAEKAIRHAHERGGDLLHSSPDVQAIENEVRAQLGGSGK
jgi:hypothetical protein